MRNRSEWRGAWRGKKGFCAASRAARPWLRRSKSPESLGWKARPLSWFCRTPESATSVLSFSTESRIESPRRNRIPCETSLESEFMRQLSKRTQYSLRALYALAENYGAGPMLIAQLAEDEAIPKKFLEQILLSLKSFG